jgi:hypothetical protein
VGISTNTRVPWNELPPPRSARSLVVSWRRWPGLPRRHQRAVPIDRHGSEPQSDERMRFELDETSEPNIKWGAYPNTRFFA